MEEKENECAIQKAIIDRHYQHKPTTLKIDANSANQHILTFKKGKTTWMLTESHKMVC